jgi:predicted ATPase
VLWREDVHDLTLQLYQDAARSCSVRSSHYTDEILTYTNAIVEHATLEDSLSTQDLLIRCYEVSGQYDKAISYGINAMRQLGFDLPLTPTRSLLAQKVVDTEQLILSHNTDQLMKEFNKVDSKTRNVLRLVDSIIHSAYQIGSPYFLLCGCEGVKWSLNHGFCDTSAPALGAFAYFKLMLQQDFNGVRFYVDMIVEMVKKSKLSMLSFGYKFYGFLHFWFVPLKETQTILLNLYKKAIRKGETAVAYSSLTGYYRFSFFCGDKLSILSKGIEQQLKSMVSVK